MESSLKNMVLTLFIITLVSSAAVGVIYQVTKEPISLAKQAKIENALSKVLPTFDNNPTEQQSEVEIDGGKVVIYTAAYQGAVVGYAVETFTNNGFSGLIKLMVGFKTDGSINKIDVLQHNETPGLGNKIEPSKSDFSVQFEGKNPADYKLAVKKDGGDVDAITASTISSRAYSEAVQRAYNALQNSIQTQSAAQVENLEATESNQNEKGEGNE